MNIKTKRLFLLFSIISCLIINLVIVFLILKNINNSPSILIFNIFFNIIFFSIITFLLSNIKTSEIKKKFDIEIKKFNAIFNDTNSQLNKIYEFLNEKLSDEEFLEHINEFNCDKVDCIVLSKEDKNIVISKSIQTIFNDDSINLLTKLKTAICLLCNLICKFDNIKSYYKKEMISFTNSKICPLCLSNEILQIISNQLKKEIESVYKDFIDDIDKLKTFFDSSNIYILEKVKSIENNQTNFEHNINESKNTTIAFNSKTNSLFDDFCKSINRDFLLFQNINSAFVEIEKLFSDIKVLSLNLNIEAVKSHNNVFILISKEFQNLISKIESFNTRIFNNLSDSIKETFNEKEKYDREMDEFKEILKHYFELHYNFISVSKEISSSYDELFQYISKIQDESKKEIYKIFNITQKFYITLEIFENSYKFLNNIIGNEINQIHEEIGGKLGLCINPEEKTNMYQNIFESLRKLSTTKIEADILNNLKKEFLGDLKEEDRHISKDFIIF